MTLDELFFCRNESGVFMRVNRPNEDWTIENVNTVAPLFKAATCFWLTEQPIRDLSSIVFEFRDTINNIGRLFRTYFFGHLPFLSFRGLLANSKHAQVAFKVNGRMFYFKSSSHCTKTSLKNCLIQG